MLLRKLYRYAKYRLRYRKLKHWYRLGYGALKPSQTKVVHLFRPFFVGCLIDLFLMNLSQNKCQMLCGEFRTFVKYKVVSKTLSNNYRPIMNPTNIFKLFEYCLFPICRAF